jgi:L-idonate 5-dehydrogenase
MNDTTQAVTLHGARDLRIAQRAPQALGAHDVRLRLGAGGICGSDLHYWQHGRVGAFVIREPLVPGHEASGVVEAVGAEVTRVKAGDRVAIDPSHACGVCDYCRAGRLNLCRKMFFLGSASVFPHAQGLFAQSFVMGERQLTPVNETRISLGEIACAEPLSIGLHAVQRAGGSLLGKRVLVTGAGTIGCMCVIAARMAGAAHVAVADVADRPLEMARAVGADEAVRSDTDAARLHDRFDIALEAAGAAPALLLALAAVERGGRVVQVGTLPDEVALPANKIMARELDLVGAFRANGEFDLAVQAIRTRRADVRPLITAQLPLARAEEAFVLAADKSRSTKVQLTFD